MGHQIIRQPDGRLAVFSAQEIADYFATLAADDMRRRVDQITRHVLAVLAGEAEKAYYQFAMTRQEADEVAAEHGNPPLASLADAEGPTPPAASPHR